MRARTRRANSGFEQIAEGGGELKPDRPVGVGLEVDTVDGRGLCNLLQIDSKSEIREAIHSTQRIRDRRDPSG
jgi:hypothetical protein